MILEGGFNIKAGATLKHISVKATAECKAYLTEEMDTEVERLELLIDPATPGVYMAPLYVSSNIQWVEEWITILVIPISTGYLKNGYPLLNPLILLYQEGWLPILYM